MGIRIAVGTVDFVEVEHSNAVAAVRDIVEAYKYRPASGGGQKVLLVRYPSMLTEGGLNALRKTLENLRDGDAPYLHVILYCADPRDLPPGFEGLVER